MFLSAWVSFGKMLWLEIGVFHVQRVELSEIRLMYRSAVDIHVLYGILIILYPTEFLLRDWKVRFGKWQQTLRSWTLSWLKTKMAFVPISKVNLHTSCEHNPSLREFYLRILSGELLKSIFKGFHFQGSKEGCLLLSSHKQCNSFLWSLTPENFLRGCLSPLYLLMICQNIVQPQVWVHSRLKWKQSHATSVISLRSYCCLKTVKHHTPSSAASHPRRLRRLIYATVRTSELTYKEIIIDVHASTEFLERALLAVDELEQGVQNVKDASARLARHFCEDPAKFQLEECLKLFADFFRRTDEVHKVRKRVNGNCCECSHCQLDLCNTYCTVCGYDGSHPVVCCAIETGYHLHSFSLQHHSYRNWQLASAKGNLEILNQFLYSGVDNKTVDRAIST